MTKSLGESMESYGAIDIAKFVCSMLIVVLHTNPLPKFESVILPLTHIAVPFFMITSSFFLSKKILKCSEEEARKCVKDYILNLLNLYIIWFLITLPVTLQIRQFWAKGLVHGTLYFLRELLLHSTWRSSWFLMCLIIDTLIIYQVQKRSNKFLNIALYLIAVVGFIYAAIGSSYSELLYLNPVIGHAYDLWIKIFTFPFTSLPVGLSYILIGQYIAIKANNMVFSSTKYYLSRFIIALCILLIEGQIVYKLELCRYTDDCYLMLIPCCYFLVMLCLSLRTQTPLSKELRTTSTVTYCLQGSLVDILGGGGVNCILILVSCWAASLFYMRKRILNGRIESYPKE